MLRAATTSLLVAATIGAAALPAVAKDGHEGHKSGKERAAFPETIALPTGWGPEGIAAGPKNTVFVGSIAQAAVYKADVRTGAGDVLVTPRAGRNHIGLKYDKKGKRLFVAGGPSGGLYVYDARTGADVAAHDVDGGFVNDVVLAKGVAYFTDSTKPVLYALPYTRDTVGQPRTIALNGLPYTTGNNANGIEATDGGRTLIVAQGNVGKLWKVDAATGNASEIVLEGGATVPNADGILLKGRKLFVVQNRLNKIAVVRLNRDLSGGRVTREITDPDFAVPTTITRQAGALYAVNAKFGTPTAGTPYEIVRVGEPRSARRGDDDGDRKRDRGGKRDRG